MSITPLGRSISKAKTCIQDLVSGYAMANIQVKSHPFERAEDCIYIGLKFCGFSCGRCGEGTVIVICDTGLPQSICTGYKLLLLGSGVGSAGSANLNSVSL